jgi:hypothetical protein
MNKLTKAVKHSVKKYGKTYKMLEKHDADELARAYSKGIEVGYDRAEKRIKKEIVEELEKMGGRYYEEISDENDGWDKAIDQAIKTIKKI